MKAQVAEKDGVLIGLWGVNPQRAVAVAFSHLSPQLRENKRACVAAMREVQKLYAQFAEVVAVRDFDEPTSDRFLKHAGFRRVNNGEIYLWAQRHFKS